eukprot:TRINITY_DN12378_c0_g1_i1.p1 TRINITY_DN12378_c0_g1~~TRINITY_DN12378_c0_g1_i1.p1  ORF type:complete len:236 (-),score=35.44 TRINITY_DN12378_c0_g1_i1:94-801(-)
MSSTWSVGSEVERLLDDVSDIWIAAVVEVVHASGSYDIRYVDDGIVEENVEVDELRSRTPTIDLPPEAWACIAASLQDIQSVCALESVAVVPSKAAKSESQSWWCSAYHLEFGRCGSVCSYERNFCPEGREAARLAIANCLALRSVELSGQMMRRPWKQRYADRSVRRSKEEDAARGHALLIPQKKQQPMRIRILDGRHARAQITCLGPGVRLGRGLESPQGGSGHYDLGSPSSV